MAERPGVLIYFDTITPFLKAMSQTDKGDLFDAIINYAQFGEIPEVQGLTAVAFDLLKPKIDKDAIVYEETCRKKRYAAYVKWAKERDEEPLSYNDWHANAMQQDARASICMHVDANYNSTTTQLNPTTTVTTTRTGTTTENSTVTKTEQERKGVQGEGKPTFIPSETDEMEFEKLRRGGISKVTGYIANNNRKMG